MPQLRELEATYGVLPRQACCRAILPLEQQERQHMLQKSMRSLPKGCVTAEGLCSCIQLNTLHACVHRADIEAYMHRSLQLLAASPAAHDATPSAVCSIDIWKQILWRRCCSDITTMSSAFRLKPNLSTK